MDNLSKMGKIKAFKKNQKKKTDQVYDRSKFIEQ
jgi:hypothetical protein